MQININNKNKIEGYDPQLYTRVPIKETLHMDTHIAQALR